MVLTSIKAQRLSGPNVYQSQAICCQPAASYLFPCLEDLAVTIVLTSISDQAALKRTTI